MKKIVTFIMIFTFCFAMMAVPVSAMDKRVEASNVWISSAVITSAEAAAHKNWKKGYYKAAAKGYVTAKQQHTATTELLLMGQHVKYSKRMSGKGKVSADTGWGYSVCAITTDPYGRIIRYTFPD